MSCNLFHARRMSAKYGIIIAFISSVAAFFQSNGIESRNQINFISRSFKRDYYVPAAARVSLIDSMINTKDTLYNVYDALDEKFAKKTVKREISTVVKPLQQPERKEANPFETVTKFTVGLKENIYIASDIISKYFDIADDIRVSEEEKKKRLFLMQAAEKSSRESRTLELLSAKDSIWDALDSASTISEAVVEIPLKVVTAANTLKLAPTKIKRSSMKLMERLFLVSEYIRNTPRNIKTSLDEATESMTAASNSISSAIKYVQKFPSMLKIGNRNDSSNTLVGPFSNLPKPALELDMTIKEEKMLEKTVETENIKKSSGNILSDLGEKINSVRATVNKISATIISIQNVATKSVGNIKEFIERYEKSSTESRFAKKPVKIDIVASFKFVQSLPDKAIIALLMPLYRYQQGQSRIEAAKKLQIENVSDVSKRNISEKRSNPIDAFIQLLLGPVFQYAQSQKRIEAAKLDTPKIFKDIDKGSTEPYAKANDMLRPRKIDNIGVNQYLSTLAVTAKEVPENEQSAPSSANDEEEKKVVEAELLI